MARLLGTRHVACGMCGKQTVARMIDCGNKSKPAEIVLCHWCDLRPGKQPLGPQR